MMDNLTFQWQRCKDGYEVKRNRHGHHVICACSNEFEQIQPAHKHAALFRQFVALRPSPKAFCEFAALFGMLRAPHEENDLAQWQVEHGNLRIALANSPADAPLSATALAPIFNGRPPYLRLAVRVWGNDLMLEPENLRDAMWAQFALALTKGERHRSCKFCKTWFAYGPGTGRRETAEYCKPKCQQTHAYQMRKESQS